MFMFVCDMFVGDFGYVMFEGGLIHVMYVGGLIHVLGLAFVSGLFHG